MLLLTQVRFFFKERVRDSDGGEVEERDLLEKDERGDGEDALVAGEASEDVVLDAGAEEELDVVVDEGGVVPDLVELHDDLGEVVELSADDKVGVQLGGTHQQVEQAGDVAL